ncbi:GNAT family N-acetyltransferase [Hymenobacter weizhouensis]|uniref:GNAT family N-acetyltransferase n=1 Tax=Hymenobacter sp. YIM 151500-1 TaxID=2987689 RepID=UPI002227FD7C|nr:GNAT family N-acetyltransferase [Hymenobacter sp. YIM 151500-1]UYZ63008.1 GNAT family N-acetyltransferase [Hymenobacter sp. YIM 151500-1]
MTSSTTSPILIRPISAADTYPLRHQVLWPQESIEYVRLNSDEQGYHFGAFRNAKLVSVISLFIDGNVARFRKFATRPDCQGQGIGSQLFRHVLAFAREKGVRRIWCDARAVNEAFYRAFGLEPEGNRFYRGTIPYIRMARELV